MIAISNSRFDLPDKGRVENNRLRGARHLTTNGAGGSMTAVDCDATNLDTGQRERFQFSGIVTMPAPK